MEPGVDERSDMACTITYSSAAACSGHVSGVAFATAWNAEFLSSYVYRQVTLTDNFNPETSTASSGSTTYTSAGVSSTSSMAGQTISGTMTVEVTGPTGIDSGILNSYSGGSGSGGTSTSTGKQSAAGGLGGPTGTSKSKGAAPMVTGMLGEMRMGIMAAAAVVGGAVGF